VNKNLHQNHAMVSLKTGPNGIVFNSSHHDNSYILILTYADVGTEIGEKSTECETLKASGPNIKPSWRMIKWTTPVNKIDLASKES